MVLTLDLERHFDSVQAVILEWLVESHSDDEKLKPNTKRLCDLSYDLRILRVCDQRHIRLTILEAIYPLETQPSSTRWNIKYVYHLSDIAVFCRTVCRRTWRQGVWLRMTHSVRYDVSWVQLYTCWNVSTNNVCKTCKFMMKKNRKGLVRHVRCIVI